MPESLCGKLNFESNHVDDHALTGLKLPPPGWYNDPSGEATHRWFDGSNWTEHVHGIAPLAPNAAEAALGAAAIETVPPIPGPRSVNGPRPAGPMPAAAMRAQAMTALPAPASSFDPVLYWVLPVGRTWQAVASGYLGLLAVLPLVGIVLGIAAVATGLWALSLGSPDPQHGGRGRPLFGIVVGGAFAVLWLCTLAAAML